MKEAQFSQKQMRWADTVFVLSFLPALFMGMFIFVKGFEIKPEPWHHVVFAVAIGGLVISGPFMIWQKLQKDRYPDLLSFYKGTPFESAGVQVVPVLSPPTAPPGGALRIGVFYQNRFDARSTLTFRLRYPSGVVAVERALDVAPGEAGFAWKDVLLPDSLPAGSTPLKLELDGTRGKGREVRFTQGKIVRSDASKALEVIALAMSAHPFHLGGNEDALMLQVAPGAPSGTLGWENEGTIQLWIRGMHPFKTKEALERAMERLKP